jgi:hypothetical protein
MNFNPEGETKMDGSSMAMVGGLRGSNCAVQAPPESPSQKMEFAAKRLQSITNELGFGIDRLCGARPETASAGVSIPGDGFISEVHMLIDIVQQCCDRIEANVSRMARAL